MGNSSFNQRNILLSFGVFILSAFIYYIIAMRRSFERFNGRIPYVWNPDFNRSLRQYISTVPSRNVLVLVGPYQCGKSRALDVMAADLAKSRHLVLNVDLSTARDAADVASLFRIAVINGLAAVHPHLSSSKATKAGEVFSGDEEIERNIDPFFGRVYNAFSRVLNKSINNSYSFTKFFDYLESLKTVLRPVVFIHDFENLQRASPSLYEAALARFSRRPLYEDFVPIVCEVKNSSASMLKERILQPIFQIEEVKELKDPTRELIVLNRALSDIELRKIMAAFGGHGGSIERVFEDLKAGIPIDESIQIQQNAVESYLKILLNGRFPSPLFRLCVSDDSIKLRNSTEISSLMPLLESGFIFLSKDDYARAAHPGVKKALCSGYM